MHKTARTVMFIALALLLTTLSLSASEIKDKADAIKARERAHCDKYYKDYYSNQQQNRDLVQASTPTGILHKEGDNGVFSGIEKKETKITLR